MNRDHYDPGLSLREARGVYFEQNGFGDDGGYSKKWVRFDLGPIPVPVPNPPSRVEAVKYHDLHHIVTGYQTDWRGEFEISCFEIAAGCGRLWFAWAINLGGVAGAALLLPRRGLAAWARGRHSGGLYRTPYDDALLDRSIGEVSAELGLDREPEPEARDLLGLVVTTLVVLGAGFAPLVGAAWLLWRLLA